MRIVCISDTHGKLPPTLPDGDVLIFAGDVTMRGEPELYQAFYDWFKSQPHPAKLAVPGNHDYDFSYFKMRSCGTWLIDDCVTLDNGMEVVGSPIVPMPEGRKWPFSYTRGSDALALMRTYMPSTGDILITHGPPFGILDQVTVLQESLGDQTLNPVIAHMRPKLHVFGHIHGGHGQLERDGTLYVNASLCNEQYQLAYDPIVVEL